MNDLERRLLTHVNAIGTITLGPSNLLDTAKLLNTTTQEMAQAKNALRDAGYLNEQSDVFTGGAVVLRITDKGRAAV